MNSILSRGNAVDEIMHMRWKGLASVSFSPGSENAVAIRTFTRIIYDNIITVAKSPVYPPTQDT